LSKSSKISTHLKVKSICVLGITENLIEIMQENQPPEDSRCIIQFHTCHGHGLYFDPTLSFANCERHIIIEVITTSQADTVNEKWATYSWVDSFSFKVEGPRLLLKWDMRVSGTWRITTALLWRGLGAVGGSQT
jgi:hypothetical protein